MVQVEFKVISFGEIIEANMVRSLTSIICFIIFLAVWFTIFSFIILFILFYFICHTIITKNIGKEEKKKWRGDLTETIGAYERLGLLEL